MQTETIVQLRLLPVLLTSSAAFETALIPAPPTEPALYARQQSVAQRNAQEGLPVRYLGTMPLFAGFRIYPGQERDWVLVSVAEAPLFHVPQGFPVPGPILAQLRRIAKSGIDFDALYVAHEVTPEQVRPDKPLTLEALMPPPPAALLRLSNRLGDMTAVLWGCALVPWVFNPLRMFFLPILGTRWASEISRGGRGATPFCWACWSSPAACLHLGSRQPGSTSVIGPSTWWCRSGARQPERLPPSRNALRTLASTTESRAT